MEKFFNSAGPIKEDKNYFIDPLSRVDWPDLKHLIDTERYFVLHAPRQTGKTSMLLKIMQVLNATGRYAALYTNIESAQAAGGNVRAGITAVCESIASAADTYKVEPRLTDVSREVLATTEPFTALNQLLKRWAQMSDKPIVLMLDEVDALLAETLISLLRQLRDGYAQRPAAFPASVILCGVRDVRDYRMRSEKGEIITGGSAFNVKAKSLTLGNFTQEEIRNLLGQHTEATGQEFADKIFVDLREDTAGQPWLVNALAHEMTWENKDLRDRTIPVSAQDYLTARESLIRSRATHLDQLADKLTEARVYSVISAILTTEGSDLLKASSSDIEYVEDLGLITRLPELKVSNGIYQEIISRELISHVSPTVTYKTPWYVDSETN
jgi:hypothetical protein